MSENRAIVVRELTPQRWEMIHTIAPVMHASRYFGVHSPEEAAAIMIKGEELGLGLAASFEFIQPVLNKPYLTPRGALALILASGLLAGMKIEEKPGSCTVWMGRKGGLEYQLTWTRVDAERSGVVKPGSAHETYPANTLRWRCIGFVADVLFPDVMGGMKRADEFGAEVDDAGNVVEGEWKTITPSEPTPAPAPAISLDTLVETYGAEAVIVAAEGRIPATDEEVAAVAVKLGATNAS